MQGIEQLPENWDRYDSIEFMTEHLMKIYPNYNSIRITRIGIIELFNKKEIYCDFTCFEGKYARRRDGSYLPFPEYIKYKSYSGGIEELKIYLRDIKLKNLIND